MSFNFSVSESSERRHRASDSSPLMTRLGRARGKALVSSLGCSVWLAGGNRLPCACFPASDFACVDYCVWMATFLAVFVNLVWAAKCRKACAVNYIALPRMHVVGTWLIRSESAQEVQWSTTMTYGELSAGFNYPDYHHTACEMVIIRSNAQIHIGRPSFEHLETPLCSERRFITCKYSSAGQRKATVNSNRNEGLLSWQRLNIPPHCGRSRAFIRWGLVTRGCWFGLALKWGYAFYGVCALHYIVLFIRSE